MVKGYRFSATLLPSTPLEWLLLHGETATEKSDVPEGFGIWLPVTKGWRELGFDIDDFPPSTMASPVGQIPQDGGEFLPFLIKYREIVESVDNGDSELHIEALVAEYPHFEEVVRPKPKPRKSRKPRIA